VIAHKEALERVLAQTRRLPPGSVGIDAALGRFAAEDLFARVPLPSFDNSAMDGYAVVAGSCFPGARLKLVDEQPAGLDRELSIKPGEAVRVFTGAPMPRGADAVIMQEETVVESDGVRLTGTTEPGEFVRRRGGDVAQGQKIVSKGDQIRPETMALLAAQGVSALAAGGEARIAIISTGDELAPPGTELQPGQIYESNSTLLRALASRCGATIASVQHCRDRADEIADGLRTAAACDVMIISGGISVGARDLVKPALTAIGGELDLWRVNIKPGKPFLFGKVGNCLAFGLPGNPVSAFVTFLLFVRPAILKLIGAGEDALRLPSFRAVVAEQIRNDGERPHYIRGSLRDGVFTPVGRQESHALFGLSRSNALLLAHPGEVISAGGTSDVFIWS
jgi:molybdopterin molybdotransferase